MKRNPDGNLHVYMLSVGQGDTSVIVSPGGSVMVIDATRPSKLIGLLDDLDLVDDTIEHLIITHPHGDHFSGANSLARQKTIAEATLAPFWHEFGLGPPTYRQFVARLEEKGTNTTFLSGYSRWYPDGALTGEAGQNPEVDPEAPFVEMLGPTNGLVRQLEDSNVFNTNHLSIMTRLAWRRFRMVSAGDCQIENWSFFDSERLMEDSCQVMRAAHHGSQNGTQWERIDRLAPEELIVSSDPDSRHHLPDLTGTAIFAEFDSDASRTAFLTRSTGTIHLTVTSGGRRSYEMFQEDPGDPIDLGAGTPLDGASNPSDWPGLLDRRVADL